MGGAEGMRTDLTLVSTSPKSSTSLSESELPEARQNLPARFWIGEGGGWTEGDLLAGVLGGMVAGGLRIALESPSHMIREFRSRQRESVLAGNIFFYKKVKCSGDIHGFITRYEELYCVLDSQKLVRLCNI